MMAEDTQPDWRKAAAEDYLERRRQSVERRNALLDQIEEISREVARVNETIVELDRAALVFGIQPADVPKPATPPPARQTPQFKDVVLEFLKAAYPETRKAVDIQAHCERTLGRKFHPKTSGMTLYRLSGDKLVERIGKSNWKYIPQEGEGPEASTSEPSIFD
jgi:hypothetical protein